MKKGGMLRNPVLGLTQKEIVNATRVSDPSTLWVPRSEPWGRVKGEAGSIFTRDKATRMFLPRR